MAHKTKESGKKKNSIFSPNLSNKWGSTLHHKAWNTNSQIQIACQMNKFKNLAKQTEVFVGVPDFFWFVIFFFVFLNLH
jgi:hypothetical protein